MLGVGRGVREHGGGQRAPRPVGLLVLFRELHPRVLLQERGQSHRRLAGELRRDARVEQGPRPEAVVPVEDAQVVVGIVEDLLDPGVREELADRRQIGDRERVDDGGGGGARQLDQEDAVTIAMKARRFGVGGHERLAAERGDGVGQRVGRADVARGLPRHSSLLSCSRLAAISSSALASVL